MGTAYFLVTHGSSDRRSQLALDEILQLTKLEIAKSELGDLLIGGGCLEGQEITLAEQLQEFGNLALNQGYDRVNIMPLFLLAGVHVCTDIPEQVEIASQNLSPALQFHITPHLGTFSQIPNLLNAKFLQINSEFSENGEAQRILIAHGSKRVGGNDTIEKLAETLNAVTAYWSVPPSLETQIELSLKQGTKHIAILPYFLSAGGITEAIANIISKYTENTSVEIQLLPIAIAPLEIAILVKESLN